MQTDFSTLPIEWMVLLVAMVIWEIAWKGFALWRACKRNEKAWFIAILLINTIGVLPIVYMLSHQSLAKDSMGKGL